MFVSFVKCSLVINLIYSKQLILLLIDWLMVCTTCLVVIVTYINGRHKNIGSRRRHIIHTNWLPCLAGPLCRPACLVCAHYQPSCFVEVDVLPTNMPWTIYFSSISMKDTVVRQSCRFNHRHLNLHGLLIDPDRLGYKFCSNAATFFIPKINSLV